MPAARRYKTQKEKQEATAAKHKRYYQRNHEQILEKRRARYEKQRSSKQQNMKTIREKRKSEAWEDQKKKEYQTNTLQALRELEESINSELEGSGSAYFERLFREYLEWTRVDPRPQASPLELPFKVFNSMIDVVAKIGNGILNEYGSGKQWRECQRLTLRIRYLTQCANEFEEVVLQTEAEKGLAYQVLEGRFDKGKLMFQGSTKEWLNRKSCRDFIPALDRARESAPPPAKSLGKPLFWS
ncbi:hypothetical protein PM082_013576 [Marasmius tenuissimus]|nr:hypothetical protein PM082_013576 [Marasmius tenuissimus]